MLSNNVTFFSVNNFHHFFEFSGVIDGVDFISVIKNIFSEKKFKKKWKFLSKIRLVGRKLKFWTKIEDCKKIEDWTKMDKFFFVFYVVIDGADFISETKKYSF